MLRSLVGSEMCIRDSVHGWHQCNPKLSIADLAHTFNISEGQVRGIITTSITSYEEFLLNSKGRSEHHRPVIEARMAELDRIRTPGMSSYELAEILTKNGFPCCANTVRADLSSCLLYTSDAADEEDSVDLCGSP
eukprot:TRINITY_DN37237_c0_g1_i1.p1 TRINITY_DN37237_c0_g1~~TRINITY_DN37237_c0_g1_i1.p1  ORF type:complete len:148 (+),score=38.58 TRINITY_DN37237_c0_g1_i1:41-445(+)